MSFTATFSLTHPLSLVVYGARPDFTNATSPTAAAANNPYSRLDRSHEILDQLNMQDTFFEGTPPDAKDVNAFFEAWLPRVAEDINQSGADGLTYSCPACGEAVQLRVVDDTLELDPAATDEMLEEDEEYLLDTVTVSAALTPSTCPHEECGADLDELPDGKIDLGFFDVEASA